MPRMETLRRISSFLSAPVLLNFTLPVVMFYLVLGTVSQKYIGLYDATHIFFSSWIIWLGFIPLPGLPVFMAIIFVNLAFKTVFKSPWRLQHAGIIITHIGALLLLLGGLFTALYSSEGYIDLAEGQRSDIVQDYHERSFVVMDEAGAVLYEFAHKDIKTRQELTAADLPFDITAIETCRNCDIVARENTEGFTGMAQRVQLLNKKPEANNEENVAGLIFGVKNDSARETRMVVEGIPQFPEITVESQTYRFALRKDQRRLPFEVQLLDFERDMHPGTAMAKAYQSRVLIKDGDAQWESIISMNEPLRYKGYTLFQSSFIQTQDGDISVLAVVWNVGRAFPYISSIAMCLGLILHLIVRQRRPKRRDV